MININVNYKYVIGILTCKNNLQKAEEQFLTFFYDITNYPILYVKFIGDPNLENDYEYDIDNSLLTLKCEDDYLNLPKKVTLFFKISKNIFPKMVGVLKVDDDVHLNLNKLNTLLHKYENEMYFGVVSTKVGEENDSISFHFKSKSDINRLYPELGIFGIKLKKSIGCAGPCYYLNSKSIDIIIKNEDKIKEFPLNYIDYLNNGVFDNLCVFEDYEIGKILYDNNIIAKDVSSELIGVIHWV